MNKYWNLYIERKKKDSLYCYFEKIERNKLYIQIQVLLQANISRDVSVVIRKLLCSKGIEIDISTFRGWLEVSIDLNCLSQVIQANYSNLIIDPIFAGRIFLKGLKAIQRDINIVITSGTALLIGIEENLPILRKR